MCSVLVLYTQELFPGSRPNKRRQYLIMQFALVQSSLNTASYTEGAQNPLIHWTSASSGPIKVSILVLWTFFCGYVLSLNSSHVHQLNHSTLDDLKNSKNNFSSEMDKEVVRRVCRTLCKRAQLCMKPKGAILTAISLWA
jgi:hypothetical protein